MLDNTTVTRVNGPIFPPLSDKINFPVIERQIGWHSGKTGNWYGTSGHKMLLRVRGEHVPTKLAIVGDSYKVVHNSDLFPYIEDAMQHRMDAHVLAGVQVSEQASHGGRDCYREYTFPNMKCDLHGAGDVAFRLIVGNSYGAKAVTLLCGAIDFWCSNGMVFGAHEKVARKHTSGITLHGLDKWIDEAQRQFVSESKRLQKLNAMPIGTKAMDDLKKLLTDKSLLSARHAEQIMEATLREAQNRPGGGGKPNAWHMYSALTDWATHSNVRDTGNDHEANTRIDRSKHVTRVMQSVERFLEGAK